MKKLFALFLFLATSFGSIAGDCQLVSQVCLDTAPSKNISGLTVYLSQVNGCWKWEDHYRCIKPNSINYCEAISKIPQCWQASVSCTKTDFNGGCMEQNYIYRCSDPSLPAPTNTTVLDTAYTITRDNIDRTTCKNPDESGLCYLASNVCVEGPETRIINGLPVTKECWKWKEDYTCIDPAYKSDCQPLIDKGCTKTSETCTETDPKAGCILKDYTYDCVTNKGAKHEEQDCSAAAACSTDANGKKTCWDSSYPADQDFGRAVATLEAAREMSTYGGIFKGEKYECRKGYGGLKSCCDEKVQAAQNNNQVLKGLVGSVGTYAGKEIWNTGSKFVYDFMYSGSGYADYAMNSCVNSLENFQFANTGISFYGLSYGGTYGALAAGAETTGMFGQTIYGLGNGFAFDPYTFVIMIIIMVIMKLMECNEEEQKLGMYRGSDLCHYVGSYCSKKIIVCVQDSHAYCCYNSKLARIIQEQGRPQIGKSWGSPKNPDCGPLTIEEIQQIDFSKIDMSEFTNDIMAAVDVPTPDVAQQRALDASVAKGASGTVLSTGSSNP